MTLFAALFAAYLAALAVDLAADTLSDVLRLDTWRTEARHASADIDWIPCATPELVSMATRWAQLLCDVDRARDALTLLDSLEPRWTLTVDTSELDAPEVLDFSNEAMAGAPSSKPKRYPLSREEGRALYVYDPQAFYRSIQSLRAAHA